MSFLFINKTLRLNNLKTRIAMNAKISVFVICIGYYIICMTVPLINVTKLLLLEKPCMFSIKKWQSRKQNEGDSNFRSSPSVVFLGKSALKKCSKFPGEHPCSDFKWDPNFSIRVFFTDTGDSQDSRGREGTIFYSTLPLLSAQDYWDIYLQLFKWDNYHVFLIATLVFTRLLLDEICHLIELTFEWLIDDAMFVCLLDELMLGFC